MFQLSKRHFVAGLLAMSLTLTAAAAFAQVSGSVRIQFRTAPRWTTVSGTRVQVISPADRQDYDMFRFDGQYYVYRGDRWYSSDRESGDFITIDDRDLPEEVWAVPRSYWRSYPVTRPNPSYDDDRRYSDEDRDYNDTRRDLPDRDRDRFDDRDRNTTFRLGLRVTPRWMMVPSMRVQVVRPEDRANYDLFLVDGEYYVFRGGAWFTSTRIDGDFHWIDESDLPDELRRVPRTYWRTYPSWDDRWDRDRRDRDDRWGNTFPVRLRVMPRWYSVRGTTVRVVGRDARIDYDLFSYGGRYYVYNGDRWYWSTTWRGEFTALNMRRVPAELRRVPRRYWRNYPDEWLDRR